MENQIKRDEFVQVLNCMISQLKSFRMLDSVSTHSALYAYLVVAGNALELAKSHSRELSKS